MLLEMQKIRNMTCMVIVLCFAVLVPFVVADLRIGFYNASCPRAEQIILQVVQEQFSKDSSISAALLRMHFHDCFVKGCDASILIDSTKKKPSEKSAGPNETVRGFEIIDEAKRRLEAACPSTVSCADIITVATRDSVAIAGGPNYAVPTGRRDGLVSNPNDVGLPGPSSSVSGAFQAFKDKGLTLDEMVTLLGAHTVGFAHCSFFEERLSNFQGTGAADSSMDSGLVLELKKICGTAGSDQKVFLDQNTSFVFDNEYYNQLKLKKGILQIDQELALDSTTAGLVSGFGASRIRFDKSFASAMVRMGSIEVLVGRAGEIRKNCRAFNPRKRKSSSRTHKRKTSSRTANDRKKKNPPRMLKGENI
ncbi:peroxidase 44 [Morus notabilis]|uniref:peroxidase 44 n=1 Tax=Morus notabilis TaxID=981085 RepID=UPI000CED56F6|nr:peroxidase 44 [Morus notabilis]